MSISSTLRCHLPSIGLLADFLASIRAYTNYFAWFMSSSSRRDCSVRNFISSVVSIRLIFSKAFLFSPNSKFKISLKHWKESFYMLDATWRTFQHHCHCVLHSTLIDHVTYHIMIFFQHSVHFLWFSWAFRSRFQLIVKLATLNLFQYQI